MERKSKAGARGVARFAAVQGIYQMTQHDVLPSEVIKNFRDGKFDDMLEETLYAADKDLFEHLIQGVADKKNLLDTKISSALPVGWELPKLDPVIRSILHAGAYELFFSLEVPTPVLISEYVDVAKAYYEGKEPGFINGVLHALGQRRAECLLP